MEFDAVVEDEVEVVCCMRVNRNKYKIQVDVLLSKNQALVC